MEKIVTQNVDLFYGEKQALFNINLSCEEKTVTALIGPSGCGKSSFLRCINRMNDTISSARFEGKIIIDGQDIYCNSKAKKENNLSNTIFLRSRVGMVFQKPNPFPKSIYENVAYGPRIHGLFSNKRELDEIVHSSLKKAGLFEEVKDRLEEQARSLSGGQQQRLCIARTIAVQPDIILMDEPCSALDPIATAKIEELIDKLKRHFTIVIVTHSMQQAARISDKTAFFNLGKVVEYNDTNRIFTNPLNKQTEDYITGKFG